MELSNQAFPQSTSSCSWKPVKNFEEYYLVSSDGRVFSIKTGKYLSISPPSYAVELCKANLKQHWPIARLVASHFIGPGKDEDIVWHKDRDSSNNTVDNLIWMSRAEGCKKKQTLDDWRNLTATKHGLIYCYGPNGETAVARSTREAAEITGISKSSVQYAIQKGTTPHGWSFERKK